MKGLGSKNFQISDHLGINDVASFFAVYEYSLSPLACHSIKPWKSPKKSCKALLIVSILGSLLYVSFKRRGVEE